MGRFVDRIRAKREMRNNPLTVSIDADRMNEITERMQPPTFVSNYKFSKPTERPQQIQDWQKYGFKSQDEMNFWINRAKSWSGGVLDTIDKVKQFQRANGLVDDGKVGWRTIDVFNRINGAGSKRFSDNPSKVHTPDAMPKPSNPDKRTAQPVQAENLRVQDAGNAVVDESYQYSMPENTVTILGHPVYKVPLPTRKTPANNNQANVNSESNNNTKYPILSNSWFANIFSSLSDQNFMNVGRDVVNLFTGQSNADASKNNEINKDFYKNQFNKIIDLVKSMGENRRIDSGGGMFLHKKGGTIKKFANGGQIGEFISFIKECVGINDDSQLKSFMQKIGKKGLAMFKQAYDKGMTPQQVRKALQGQNSASSAQQSSYMKKGGCIACEMQNGGRFKYTKQELQKANAKANVNQIPVLVNSLKCGGKTKKKLIKKR